MLVVKGSMPMVICSRFHKTLANNGNIKKNFYIGTIL